MADARMLVGYEKKTSLYGKGYLKNVEPDPGQGSWNQNQKNLEP